MTLARQHNTRIISMSGPIYPWVDLPVMVMKDRVGAVWGSLTRLALLLLLLSSLTHVLLRMPFFLGN